MRRRFFLGSSLVSMMMSLAACGGHTTVAQGGPANEPPPPEPPTPAPAPTTTTAPAPAPLAWKSCPIFTGEQGTGAECATIEVPLDWADPNGKKAELFVKRISGSGPNRKQVWLLQGGPGGAGDGMEDMAAELSRQDASVDVYIPDHRGTGRSTYLGCKQQQFGVYSLDDWQICLEEVKQTWGDKLATFSTTTAARDVGYAIERTRAVGQEVHVYGVSYGTYWAQRYLQIFPQQPTTVVLDGVCQSGICSLTKYGKWFDDVGKKFLGECAQDAFCASKMGPDPVAKVREALAALDARTCSGITAGWRAAEMRRIFTMFLASFQMRNLVPATAYRILRCSADDVTAINHMLQTITQWFGGRRAWANGDDLSSDVLGMNIAMSELEEEPPISKAQLLQLMADAVFFEKDDTQLRDLYDIWPRYAHDEYVGKYPQSPVPVLLLNGTLDPQTPVEFAQIVAPHYTAPHSQLVVLPRAAHGTVYQSPTTSRGRACGWTLWTQFIGAPASALDTSCKDRILPHDFENGGQLASAMFGTPSLWSLLPQRTPATKDPAFEASLKRDLFRAARITRLPW